MADEPIKVFNHGQMKRDFTYIDDIVAGVVATLDRTPAPDPAFDRARPDPSSSWAPYRLFNIGHSEPVALLDFIAAMEASLGREAVKDLQPMQPGDVPVTFDDTDRLANWTGVNPNVSIDEGVKHFVAWYGTYVGV